MTYHEIYESVKKSLAKAKAEVVDGNVAFECDIVGEGEGKFYIQVKDGSVYVEPYDYKDCDARLIADAETFIEMASGKLSPEAAYVSEPKRLYIDGDVGKALEFLLGECAIDKSNNQKQRLVKIALSRYKRS